MNLFENIHETRITSLFAHPAAKQSVPLHRRLFPVHQTAGDIARAAVREVIG
jgi:hypothetical protein